MQRACATMENRRGLHYDAVMATGKGSKAAAKKQPAKKQPAAKKRPAKKAAKKAATEQRPTKKQSAKKRATGKTATKKVAAKPAKKAAARKRRPVTLKKASKKASASIKTESKTAPSSRRKAVTARKRTSKSANEPTAANAKARRTRRKAAVKKRVSKPSSAKRGAGVRAAGIDDYVAKLSGWQEKVVSRICGLVLTAEPQISASIKWAQPVFEFNGPLAYVKAHSKSVNFGFWRGAELPDLDGLLEGSGDKMRHIKLKSEDDIDEHAFSELVKQAVDANRRKGDPTRK